MVWAKADGNTYMEINDGTWMGVVPDEAFPDTFLVFAQPPGRGMVPLYRGYATEEEAQAALDAFMAPEDVREVTPPQPN